MVTQNHRDQVEVFLDRSLQSLDYSDKIKSLLIEVYSVVTQNNRDQVNVFLDRNLQILGYSDKFRVY